MTRAAALLVLAVLPLAAQEVALTPQELPGGIRVIAGHPNGNVLVVPTPDGAVLVDAQSAGPAVALAQLVDRVRVVVSTHYHEDHIGGNPRFRASGAVLLGHEALAAQALRDTLIPELDWHRTPAPRDALPTRTVARDTVLMVGGMRVEVWHVPRAHTDGDLMVWVPAQRVLHTGDVYEVDAFPFVDLWAGGTVDGMIAAVDRVLAAVPGDATVVPGHGRPTDVAALRAYRAMLADVRDRVRTALAAGPLTAAAADAIAAPYLEGRGSVAAGRRFVGLVARDLGGSPR